MSDINIFHKSMLVTTNKYGIISLEELWNKLNNIEANKTFDIQLLDKGEWTKLVSIDQHIKEKPFKMRFLSIKSGNFIICQDNHIHILSNQDEKPSCLKDTVLKSTISYDNYKVYADSSVVSYCGKEDELIQILKSILNNEKLEINRNVISFSTKSLDYIGKLILIMIYLNISVKITPSIEKNKKHQVFNITFSPTEEHRFYFDGCNEMKKFRFLPNQYTNKHIDNILMYKEVDIYDDIVYSFLTESSTAIINGIYEHDSRSNILE